MAIDTQVYVMVTVRMTVGERSRLRNLAGTHGVSLNTHCCNLLGVDNDFRPRNTPQVSRSKSRGKRKKV